MPRPTIEQLDASVKNWNDKYPVGTPVRRFAMMDRSGEFTETVTRSEAWVMGGHSPMILVEGHSGGQHLDQLEVTRPPASHIPAADTLPQRAAAESVGDGGVVLPAWLLAETFAIQHNPNCPSPFAVRLIGRGFGRLDLAQYANPAAPDFTKDKIGFGVTIEEAAERANVARG